MEPFFHVRGEFARFNARHRLRRETLAAPA
jgi:hypothetical protein